MVVKVTTNITHKVFQFTKNLKHTHNGNNERYFVEHRMPN